MALFDGSHYMISYLKWVTASDIGRGAARLNAMCFILSVESRRPNCIGMLRLFKILITHFPYSLGIRSQDISPWT